MDIVFVFRVSGDPVSEKLKGSSRIRVEGEERKDMRWGYGRD